MTSIVSAKGLSKSYGQFKALDNASFEIETGKIVGLIGPNGAGKTTALRCLLGLATFDGDLKVLGKNPHKQRIELMKEVAYIADTAVLPKWITVTQLLDYLDVIHPNFSREKAESFLSQTDIRATSRVQELSKGMVTQLHLATTISIDAKLMVLDEPTLGLDIVYRKRFYEQLLNDYFDEERTVLITTHQVEEIEPLLTDLMFIKQGRIILDTDMESVAQRYTEVEVKADLVDKALAFNPISQTRMLGGMVMVFENTPRDTLKELGPCRNTSVADLFVAKMSDKS
ncbi:MAG TPA: multidrug ABC transporter ATP-binding protein [Gammaproteobacteria bacterium]|nr:multidrug ABC transporter ATP-binding protein [Gammaproteobacteria bacterium]